MEPILSSASWKHRSVIHVLILKMFNFFFLIRECSEACGKISRTVGAVSQGSRPRV